MIQSEFSCLCHAPKQHTDPIPWWPDTQATLYTMLVLCQYPMYEYALIVICMILNLGQHIPFPTKCKNPASTLTKIAPHKMKRRPLSWRKRWNVGWILAWFWHSCFLHHSFYTGWMIWQIVSLYLYLFIYIYFDNSLLGSWLIHA